MSLVDPHKHRVNKHPLSCVNTEETYFRTAAFRIIGAFGAYVSTHLVTDSEMWLFGVYQKGRGGGRK